MLRSGCNQGGGVYRALGQGRARGEKGENVEAEKRLAHSDLLFPSLLFAGQSPNYSHSYKKKVTIFDILEL